MKFTHLQDIVADVLSFDASQAVGTYPMDEILQGGDLDDEEFLYFNQYLAILEKIGEQFISPSLKVAYDEVKENLVRTCYQILRRARTPHDVDAVKNKKETLKFITLYLNEEGKPWAMQIATDVKYAAQLINCYKSQREKTEDGQEIFTITNPYIQGEIIDGSDYDEVRIICTEESVYNQIADCKFTNVKKLTIQTEHIDNSTNLCIFGSDFSVSDTVKIAGSVGFLHGSMNTRILSFTGYPRQGGNLASMSYMEVSAKAMSFSHVDLHMMKMRTDLFVELDGGLYYSTVRTDLLFCQHVTARRATIKYNTAKLTHFHHEECSLQQVAVNPSLASSDKWVVKRGNGQDVLTITNPYIYHQCIIGYQEVEIHCTADRIYLAEMAKCVIVAKKISIIVDEKLYPTPYAALLALNCYLLAPTVIVQGAVHSEQSFVLAKTLTLNINGATVDDFPGLTDLPAEIVDSTLIALHTMRCEGTTLDEVKIVAKEFDGENDAIIHSTIKAGVFNGEHERLVGTTVEYQSNASLINCEEVENSQISQVNFRRQPSALQTQSLFQPPKSVDLQAPQCPASRACP